MVPTASKEKGKTFEVPKPANRRPNLSDIHIPMPEILTQTLHHHVGCKQLNLNPRPDGEQLLQMLSTLQKQMEDQQIELTRLRE